jgi:D-aminoacyl-tRNA deacylase
VVGVMRLLVECTEDSASVTIAENLREAVDFEERGRFNGHRVLAYEDWRLVTIDEMHITNENIHERLPPSLTDPELVVFLSRHKSESGKPTLSVHPIGNFADAPYGGEPGTVVDAAPGWMAGLFDAMRKRNPDGYEVTYEATHHGPYLEAPTLFYELGSTEDEWTDEQAGQLLAEALLDAIPREGRNVLWVGGGHYAPQVNDAVRDGQLLPGHVIPGWATGKGITEETLEQAIDAIPDCEGYVLQPDPTTDDREVAKRLDAIGVDRVEVDV